MIAEIGEIIQTKTMLKVLEVVEDHIRTEERELRLASPARAVGLRAVVAALQDLQDELTTMKLPRAGRGR